MKPETNSTVDASLRNLDINHREFFKGWAEKPVYLWMHESKNELVNAMHLGMKIALAGKLTEPLWHALLGLGCRDRGSRSS